MKKILFFIDLTMLDRQVLKPCNYKTLWKDYKRQNGGNSGNKLFTLAVEKLLLREDVSYEYYDNAMTSDEINDRFDCIMIPMANIFNANPIVINEMNWYSSFFEVIKIPTYIIGVGVQAESYEKFHELYNAIERPAARFISVIYNTGGEFALRGNFTKLFFDKLGFHSAVVTGCPSIYQFGRDISIIKKPVEKKEFKMALNGDLLYLQQENILRFLKDKNSIFMDQNEFTELLYAPQWESDTRLSCLIKRYTYIGLEALVQDRVKLIYDIPVWIDYLKNNNFHFSFGSRIHGNIAAILSGIPAMVYARDSRTREMAEFYHIPLISKMKFHDDLYDLYSQLDYSRFNKEFAEKYDNFQRFFQQHNIFDSIENKAIYEKESKEDEKDLESFSYPEIQNEQLLKLKQTLDHKLQCYILDGYYDNVRKLKNSVKKLLGKSE